MCINTSIACSSSKVFIFSVGYVLMSSCITIFFSKPKIDNINQVSFFTKSHQKIIWFDISMNEIFGMNIFYSTYLWRELVRFGINEYVISYCLIPSIRPSLCPSVRPTICPSVHPPSVHPSIDPSVHLFTIHSSIYLCIHLFTNWSASSNTVLRVNLREQKLNKSSKLGPSNSITKTL